MPRIEFLPTGLKEGDASPSVDVCTQCSGMFAVGAMFAPPKAIEWAGAEYGEEIKSFKIGSVDVEHPTYAGANQRCCVCNDPLLGIDDGYQ